MDNIVLTNADSFVLIKFRGEGDAQPELYFSNVNAFQIMGSAYTLEVHGKSFFIQQENERADRQRELQISVAKPEVLIPRK
jgi:hypothetical protein